MIDNKKVIAMTRMASYEKNEGKKHIEIARYFRSDYISIQLIKAWFSGTIVFLVLAFMRGVYDADLIMKDLYKTDILEMVKQIIIGYAVFIFIYMLLCYLIASFKYSKALHAIKIYYLNLKSMSKYYK